MEIQLRPFVGQKEAVLLVRVELRHLAGERVVMQLHVAALALFVIDQPTLGRLEGGAHGDPGIRVGEAVAGVGVVRLTTTSSPGTRISIWTS